MARIFMDLHLNTYQDNTQTQKQHTHTPHPQFRKQRFCDLDNNQILNLCSYIPPKKCSKIVQFIPIWTLFGFRILEILLDQVLLQLIFHLGSTHIRRYNMDNLDFLSLLQVLNYPDNNHV